MSSLVFSKYNVITTDQKESVLLIHNILNHSGIALKMNYANKMKSMLEKNAISCDDHYLIEKLLENGIVIEDSVDENAEIKKIKDRILEASENELSLIIIPTNQCNFRCIYCWEHTQNQRDEMTNKKQNQLLEFVSKNAGNFKHIDIEWFGGEPLLAPNVIKNLLKGINEIARRNRIPYLSSITTNGYSLDIEMFRFLLKYHNNFFQITIDGPARLHNNNRPLKNNRGTFDTILDNLKRIRDNVQTHSFKIILRLNITGDSQQYMKEYIEILEREFSRDKRFRLYVHEIEDLGGPRHDEIHFLNQSNQIEEVQLLALEKDIMTHALKMLKPGDYFCRAQKNNSYVIYPDGTFSKCDVSREPYNNVAVLDDNGSLIINDSNYSFWKNQQEPAYCLDCLLRPLCFGMKCPYTHSIVKRKCELHNNLSILRNAVRTYYQEGKYSVY